MTDSDARRGVGMERSWPDYDCPECGESIWYDGFDDATTVDGQGEYRSVAHCGVCEFVAISRHDGPHTWEGDDASH